MESQWVPSEPAKVLLSGWAPASLDTTRLLVEPNNIHNDSLSNQGANTKRIRFVLAMKLVISATYNVEASLEIAKSIALLKTNG
jgi:alanine-alpha-ketoisovalerate/valine-pyruvate aminotransferase